MRQKFHAPLCNGPSRRAGTTAAARRKMALHLSVALPVCCLMSLSVTTARAQQATPAAAPQTVELAPVEVISTAPGSGAGVAVDKVPAFTTSVGAAEFARTNSPSVTDTLQQQVPGAISIDTNGNDFQQELYYRGFVASPIPGRPQGLAVYQDGVRVNEAFGDTVNWDLIPPQAIYRADVFTNNPVFGLNALGGAVNLQMKNGFLWQGFEAQAMGGSWGRVSGMFQYGMQKDAWSLYVTGDALHDDGWRYSSPSSLVRLFGDLGYRTQDAEVHLVAQGATNNLGVVGATPVGLLAQDYRSVFTNPQTSLNQVGSLALNTKINVSPTWTLQNNAYIRAFYQHHVDGNDADFEGCSSKSSFGGSLCLQDDDFDFLLNGAPKTTAYRNQFVILNQNGQTIPYQGDSFPYGTIDQTWVHSNTVGESLQATNTDKIIGHPNHFTVGASVDQSWLTYSATSTLGVIDPSLTVIPSGFPGAGSIVHTLGDLGYQPTYLTGTTTYWGLYALDTFDITPQLAATAGGRLNIATISTQDASGTSPELNSSYTFTRFNPVVGLAYKITPNVTVYAGYSEANRAPTPLELDCSNPLLPCVLASSLISDPPLQQVVSHTVEAGFRGNFQTAAFGPFVPGSVNWKAGYFRTESDNDIIQLSSVLNGHGYFANVPETLRQGVEAGALLTFGPLQAYANYSFINATYQFSGTLSSPNNPFADANGNIFVKPGDHIPGIPQNQAKFGLEYAFTPKLKFGTDVIIVGSQYYVGDDSNQNPQLPAYWVANIHGSYQITDHVQLFGMVNNLFNNHYATYGTFFDTGTDAQLATATQFTNDPRTITPAQPLSMYGGVKVTF
jgi:iron complex outermembrane receptor protein